MYSPLRLARHCEGDVVVDDCSRSYWQSFGRLEVKQRERDPVIPGLSQHLHELHGEMLATAAAVAESERRVARRVTHRVRRPVDTAVHRAERAVRQLHIAPVFDGE